jgi:hypothetical protein
MSQVRWPFRLTVCVALVLTACGSGATPQLIGAHPKQSASTTGYAPPAHLLVVYTSHLTLEVADVSRAAEAATRLAYDHGGYLVSSHTWYQDGRKHTTLTLAVPVPQFDALRNALLGLGTLVGETVSGEPKPIRGDDWRTFSHITLHLQPAPSAFSLPKLPVTGWDPARTFERAFGVFAAIFTFLVDIVIWATVVVGPFVLMGLGLRALARRMRPR